MDDNHAWARACLRVGLFVGRQLARAFIVLLFLALAAMAPVLVYRLRRGGSTWRQVGESVVSGVPSLWAMFKAGEL